MVMTLISLLEIRHATVPRRNDRIALEEWVAALLDYIYTRDAHDLPAGVTCKHERAAGEACPLEAIERAREEARRRAWSYAARKGG